MLSDDAPVQATGSSVSVWSAAICEAIVSVLQMDQASGTGPLMRQIAGRLDAGSVRRLTGELVRVSASEAPIKTRARAAASLVDMSRSGQLGGY